MRLHAPLDDLLTGKGNLRAFRVLVTLQGREVTGRELAALAGISSSQALTALHALEREGAVHHRVVGPAHLWGAQSNHVLFVALRELLLQERGWPRELENDLVAGLAEAPVERAVLFGSVVAGRERPTSDIDLWVEVLDEGAREKVRRTLFRLGDRIAEKYGNPLAPIVHTRREISTTVDRSLLAEVRTHGREILPRGRA